MKKRKIILGIGFLFLILILVYFFQGKLLKIDVQQLKQFILSFGIFGPLIFILINVTTIVVSPLTSLPFWPISLALWGYWSTCLFVAVGNSLGSAANFWIARRFGRPVVAKLVGRKGIKKVDEVTETIGLKTLFIARFFSGAASDYISYAAGLTIVSFKPYFLISTLVTLPMIFFNLYLLDRALSFNPIWIVFIGAWGYALAVAFPVLFYQFKKRQTANREK